MKLTPFLRWSWLDVFLAVFLIGIAPLQAADSSLDQSGEAAPSRPLHYLSTNAVSAVVILTPPPLPGSSEQTADLNEVREVFHASTSNEIAAAYSEKNLPSLILRLPSEIFSSPENFQ